MDIDNSISELSFQQIPDSSKVLVMGEVSLRVGRIDGVLTVIETVRRKVRISSVVN